MSVFSSQYTIRLADTDAAGVIFFSRIYDYAHACYEDFMQSQGLPLATILEQGQYVLPLVSSSAEYYLPLKLGEAIRVELSVKSLGNSSFCLNYQFFNATEALSARVETAHVCVSLKEGEKIPLPTQLLILLQA